MRGAKIELDESAAALSQREMGARLGLMDCDDDLFDQRAQQLLLVARRGGGRLPFSLQGGAQREQTTAIFCAEGPRPLPFAPGQVGLGLLERTQGLLPLSLETTGDKSVVGIDGHVAALRTLRPATRALDGVMPQGERPVVIRFGPLRCAERGLETRRSKGVEDGACNGGVDFDRVDAQTIDAAACPCTMVARGSGVPGGVSAQPSASVAAGGEAFKKRSLPHRTARLVSAIGGPPIFPMEG